MPEPGGESRQQQPAGGVVGHRAPQIVDQEAAPHESAQPLDEGDDLMLREMVEKHRAHGAVVRRRGPVGEDIAADQGDGQFGSGAQVAPRDGRGVGIIFDAGEVDRDPPFPRPKACGDGDVAAPRAQVQNPQPPAGRPARRLLGDEAPHQANAAEPAVDQRDEAKALFGQLAVKARPVHPLRFSCARFQHPTSSRLASRFQSGRTAPGPAA